MIAAVCTFQLRCRLLFLVLKAKMQSESSQTKHLVGEAETRFNCDFPASLS